MRTSDAPFRRTIDLRLCGNEALRPALAEAGCAVSPLTAGGSPDVVVADLRGTERPLGLVGRARRAAGGTPLVLVTGTDPLPTLCEAAERHVLVQTGADAAPVVRAVGRAVRSADMAREAGLRVSALTALELPLGQADAPPAEERVVVLGEPGPHALATLHALAPYTSFDAVLSRAQALRALEAGDAGALVLAPGPERRDAAALVRLVRRQSVLADVPVVIVEARRTDRHVAYWAKHGADAVLLPEEEGLIAAAVSAGIRRRTMDRRLKSLLARTVMSERGAEARIAGNALFDACLAERCRRGGAFSLGALRLSVPDAAPDDRALSEAAMYLSFGVGPEDMMARPAPDVFLFQLPFADALGAQRTMRALSSVTSDLKFGDEGTSQTFDTRLATASYQAGDDPERMIVRAMGALRTARVRVAVDA